MLYIKDNTNSKMVPIGFVLPPSGTSVGDATATPEDVFAPATFYAGDSDKKTGVLDPILEYVKYQDLFELQATGRQTPTEEKYINDIRPVIVHLANKVWGYVF